MEGKEKRQLVLLDVNICFLGSEALLQKLQRLHFNLRSLSFACGNMWSRKNQLSHNALLDPSACDVRSTRFLGAGPAHAVWTPTEILRPSPVLVYDAFISAELSVPRSFPLASAIQS